MSAPVAEPWNEGKETRSMRNQGSLTKSAPSLIIFMISLHYLSFMKPAPHCQSCIDYRPSALPQLIDADSCAVSPLSGFKISSHNDSSLLSMRTQSISKCSNQL